MPATADRTDALIARVIGDLHARNPQAAANLEYDLAQCETDRKVQQFSVTTKRDGLVTFSSDLSDAEVLQSLRGQRSQFAQDLAAKFNRLSPAQYAWAHKLAVDSCQRQQQVTKFDDTQVSQFEALFNAFEAAKAKGAKRLTLRFKGVNVKPNRDLSVLWVTSQTEFEQGDYGLKPKYLGKVTTAGCDSRLSDDVKAIIMAAASDPLTAAIRYGKVSGECSCCGRELTDPQSIERGIGPICATKFGW
jgi:hypothetical protein